MNTSLTNRLLGYPPDARLLILNADDFGMCHAVNEAVFRAFDAGLLRSATLMPPCPWAPHAMHFLADHIETPFGIHLTVISDWAGYRWGPLTPAAKVPSLLNADGYFHNFDEMPWFLAHLRFDELELEFRAQIEAVLSAGLAPTHLDWHSLRIDNRLDIAEVMLGLAREYGLALRVRGRPTIEKVQSLDLPCNDHDFLDSYLLGPNDKATRFAALLRELPAGLNEWALHPALDTPELQTLEPSGGPNRLADLDFLTSPQAQEIIQQEGIILLDYRALQAVWRGAGIHL